MPLFSADASAFDPTNYEFHETSYENRKAREDLYQTRVDFRTPIAVGDDSSIQVGVKYTKRHKTNEIDSRIYGDYSDDLTMDQVLGSPVSGIYDGRYPFGPTISRAAADGFFDAHSGDFELDEEGTVGDSLGGDYRINEKIFAAYAMATFQVGEFTAIPGVRMEKTKSDYAAKAVIDSLTVADLTKDFDTFGSQSYTDWFPGLNLRWNATPSLVLRAAVTRAIGRPNYEQLAPTVSVNTGDNEVTMGNPNLQPLKSTNYDLAAEYYLGRSGIISIAGFYKTISNPIYSSTIEQSGTFAGRDLVDAQVTLPVNAESAFVKGIEINAQTELSFLPSPLDGLGINANATFISSKVAGVPGHPDDKALFGQYISVSSAQLYFV
jgi:TonB-dependent receptor